jgi:hypothetical protein
MLVKLLVAESPVTDTITEPTQPTQNATAIPQNSTDNSSLDKKENNANQENSSLSTIENGTSVDSSDSKTGKK